MSSQGKVLHVVTDAQTLDSKSSIQGHEDMIALGTDALGGRFGQSGIGLEGFVEAFDFPPFLVDRLDAEGLPIEIATGQIKGARTTVFVCKDLAVQQDGEIQSFNPAELG
ncbi:uncharacterized protein METZ01_LOCUS508156, partial [marine metagenome]